LLGLEGSTEVLRALGGGDEVSRYGSGGGILGRHGYCRRVQSKDRRFVRENRRAVECRQRDVDGLLLSLSWSLVPDLVYLFPRYYWQHEDIRVQRLVHVDMSMR